MSTRMLLGIVGALCASMPAPGQTAAKTTSPKTAAQFRTPWGDPDLQGSWSNATTTPMERPAKYAGREFLTPDERKAMDKDTAVGTDKRSERGTAADVNDAYNAFWWEKGFSDGRTSLVYDPPDGRIPPLTAEAKQRLARQKSAIQAGDLPGSGAYNGPEDFELYTRCVVRAALPRVPTGYDNNYQIVQAPGTVSILQEQMHETRVIPLYGRPHLDSGVRQWLGDSRGHWEGDTLVVETTNFSDQTTFMGATKNMKLIERWRRVDDGHLDYRFTVEDPATWTGPWSAAITWSKTGMLYEYACHEDNYGLYGILAGARAERQKSRH